MNEGFASQFEESVVGEGRGAIVNAGSEGSLVQCRSASHLIRTYIYICTMYMACRLFLLLEVQMGPVGEMKATVAAHAPIWSEARTIRDDPVYLPT